MQIGSIKYKAATVPTYPAMNIYGYGAYVNIQVEAAMSTNGYGVFMSRSQQHIK
jgi:hypothetical protein